MAWGRRDFLRVSAGLAVAAAWPRPVAAVPPSDALLFFTRPEAAVTAAAIDVLLPKDDAGPGGVEAGVVVYIDRQLAGAFGGGAGMYLAGPWHRGTVGQGWQLPSPPAEIYRMAIADMETVAWECYGGSFPLLAPWQREEILAGLDSGDVCLPRVPGKDFMGLLLANALEGYFADPAYGGNRGMAAWRMIGYPGARGDYAGDIVPYRDRDFPAEPVSLADLR